MPINRPIGRRRQTGQRAVFRPPPDFAVLTSLWVDVATEDGVTTITLQHDYPPAEFAPAAGWKVEAGDTLYNVTAVNGRVLTTGG